MRRDWCRLSSTMGRVILEKVLGGGGEERLGEEQLVDWIHEYLPGAAAPAARPAPHFGRTICDSSLAVVGH